MMKGKLIVLEGVDSSGKRTQSEILVQRLKENNYDVEVADFPQYYSSFYGQLIARYLRGEFGKINEISPYLAAVLYAGDRLEAKHLLKKWIDDGNIVVCNRYATSSQAFMTAKLQSEEEQLEFLEWVKKLEYGINQIPKPDLVLYLNVPVEVAQKWIRTKQKREYLGDQKRDIHEKDISYLTEVERVYQKLLKTEKNWLKIDCTTKDKVMSVQEISDKIWKEAHAILK